MDAFLRGLDVFFFHTPPGDVILVGALGVGLWSTLVVLYEVFWAPPKVGLYFSSSSFPRKLFLPAAAAAVLLIIVVLPIKAQGRTPANPEPGEHVADIPQQLEPHLTPLLVRIGQFEANYYDAHGEFAQALPLFFSPPGNGNAALPDALLRAPTRGVTGQQLWSELNLNATPVNIRVDVYDGPAGKGYVVIFEAVFDGQSYQLVVNSGAETFRGPAKVQAAAWQLVVTEANP